MRASALWPPLARVCAPAGIIDNNRHVESTLSCAPAVIGLGPVFLSQE